MWRSVVILLGVASGCNQFFSLDKTALEPQVMPDAGPIPACPGTGQTPAFAPNLYQVNARLCTWYSADETGQFAVSICFDDTGAPHLAGADSGGAMQPLALSDDRSPHAVRLAPEGTSALITSYDSTGSLEITEYTRNGPTWDAVGSAFKPVGSGYQDPSTPTRGPNPRFVIERSDSTSGAELMAELERQPDGSWTEVRTTPLGDLVTSTLVEPQLSPDGLRLVFLDQPPFGAPGGPTTRSPVYYSDRATIDQPFGKRHEITSLPGPVTYPFITADCGRIYFVALNTVWYLSEY